MDNRHTEDLEKEYNERINRIIDEKLHGEDRERSEAAVMENTAASQTPPVPASDPSFDRVMGSYREKSRRLSQAPISLESFDRAYDRHMRQVHEQLEHSRRLAQSVNSPSAQSERAAPPPPPRQSYAPTEFVAEPDESFLIDEASHMARQTVANTSWHDNTERVVIAGSLGVHSSMEDTAKDRISREDRIRESLNDSQNLFPHIDFEKIASLFRIGKKPSPKKERPVEHVPHVDPDRLASALHKSLSRTVSRLNFLAVLGILLLYATFAGNGFLPGPAFLQYENGFLVPGLVNLILFALCLIPAGDVLGQGFRRLFRGKPDIDSVIALSAVLTLIAGIVTVSVPSWHVYPVSFLVPVLWLFFRLLSRRITLSAKYRAVRAVSRYKDAETLLLTVDGGYDDFPTFMRTDAANFDRFYHGIRTETLGERIVTVYVLLASVLALVFSLITSIFPPEGAVGGHVFLAFATLLSTVPSGALVLSHSLSYAGIAKRMRQAGAYPGGSRSFLSYSREGFTVLTDRDIYPDDAVTITDYKLLDAFDRKTVFRYTASLLSSVGCSLASPFVRFARDEYAVMAKVSDVHFTGEAISADVDGHQVIIGDDAAMRRAGFRTTRIPTRTPVYVAIDGSLAAVFALNYHPDTDTEYSLRLLIRNLRIPVIAARDFNITVDRVEKAFRIRQGVVVCPPIETRVALANPDRRTDATGVVFLKPGIRPIAETIEGSRRFRIASSATLITGILGGFIGLVLAAVMLFNGWFASATPANLALYQLLWTLPAIIISFWSKKY